MSGSNSLRTDKTHAKPVKVGTTPMKSKVTKTGKMQHPCSAGKGKKVS